MDILQVIILGIVQGLGEFLPISSTAHLVIVPYFFGWKDPGLAFDVALHAGTLVAVLGYFWRDWISIIKSAIKHLNPKFQFKDQDFLNIYDSKLLGFLIIATIPGVLVGYFLEGYVESIFRHPLVIASTLSLAAVILYVADRFFERKKEIKDVTFLDSVLIGIAQAIAVIPGVSRSGATIIAGRWVGFSREAAARFSFLLSMPIILGATLFNLPVFFNETFKIAPLFLGVLTSAISGYLTIAFLLKFLQKYGFAVFVGYRFLLAMVIVFFYLQS